MMNEYKLVRCNDDEARLQMHKIREEVLFTSGEYNRDHADDKNPDNHCFIFLFNNTPVATIRLDFLAPDIAAVRLVAVLPKNQGQKIGSKMLSAIEDYAKERGILKLVINSAINAKKFYDSIGYVTETWIDPGEGISVPTIQMSKKLIRQD
jgi:GNAT superfamily N-acetyltransferase